MRAEDFHLPDPAEVPPEIIAPVITRLATLQSALAARLIEMPVGTNHQDSAPQAEDELLTVADAARLLNVGEDWIYRRAGRLPFTRRLSEETWTPIIRPFHPSICTPVVAGIILYLEKGLNRRAKRLGRDQGSRSGTDRRLQTMPESIDAVIRNRQMLGG